LPGSAVVAVAMSGGVDSSVAAARVVAAGVRSFAITLAMWPADRAVERDRGCCSIDAVEDARRVATALGVRHYVWNLERDFEQAVIRDFEDEYAAGRTPNPCVRCNQRVKFGLLLDRARAVGATHVATGHYARTGSRRSMLTLHRANDASRDQAYVLHRLSQRQLASAIFPVGTTASKADIRAEAAALGLTTAAKPESQDLCFVERDQRAELSRRLAGRFSAGPVINADGDAVGIHPGLPFFTVGQRGGLGLANQRSDAAPLYVIELRTHDNSIVVGPRAALARRVLEADDCSWVAGDPPPKGIECEVQLRSHGRPARAAVHASDRAGRVELDAPVEQVAPGQSLVLYAGHEVIGGGVIRHAA
jgi:tRNA-specific 2-thiouridylase